MKLRPALCFVGSALASASAGACTASNDDRDAVRRIEELCIEHVQLDAAEPIDISESPERVEFLEDTMARLTRWAQAIDDESVPTSLEQDVVRLRGGIDSSIDALASALAAVRAGDEGADFEAAQRVGALQMALLEDPTFDLGECFLPSGVTLPQP